MKAYCDESGKHGAATVITICGLLMSSKTCKELQRRWLREAARAPKIPLPFHMSDCVVGTKLFEYLREDESTRVAMQYRMINTLKGLDIQAYGASLIRAEYKPLESQLRDNPKLRDPWFLMFEGAVLEILDRSKNAGKIHRIDLVFDRQDEFADRALGLFKDILETKAAKAERLKTLSFAPKDDVAALQAIDVITYEVNRFFTDKEDALKVGVQQSVRGQFEEIQRHIEVNGHLWGKDGITALIEETAVRNLTAGEPS